MQNELKQFATWLKDHCNLAPSSIHAYTRDISNYLDTKLDVDAWIVHGDVSASRSNQRAAALKAFCNHLGIDAPAIRYRKVREKKAPYLDVDQVQAWLQQVMDIGAREYAAVALMYGSGLRVGEVVGAKLADLDIEHGMLEVLGKGGEWRSVPLAEHTIHALKFYLRTQRPRLEVNSRCDLIFLGDRGGHYRARSLTAAVREAARRANIPELLRPNHELRHMCATHMLEGEALPRVIQDLLGHKSERMTMRYAQVSPKLRRGNYNKAHPWGSKKEQIRLLEVG